MLLDVLLAALGAAVVVLVVVDVVWSTLSIGSGMGPVSRAWVSAVWRRVLSRHHRTGRDHDRLARRGFWLLLSVAVLWVVLLLAGWSLVMQAGDRTALASDGSSAGVGERVYLAAYSVVTLGLGDIEPGNGYGQLVIILAAITGLMLLTLTVTYFVPLVTAASDKRQMGSLLAGLGRPPQETITMAWDGEQLAELSSHLTSLTSSVTSLSQQHVIYPVLDLLPARTRTTSAALGMAALDEFLTLHDVVLDPSARLPRMAVQPLRHAVQVYLETLRDGFVPRTSGTPGRPSVDALREAGVPLTSPAVWDAGYESLAERRELLLALVQDDGWTWDDVYSEGDLGQPR